MSASSLCLRRSISSSGALCGLSLSEGPRGSIFVTCRLLPPPTRDERGPEFEKRSGGGLGAGLGDAAFVREDHRLDAVAKVELHQYAFDVGLDRRVLDHELAGDLAVGESTGDQRQHLAL